MEVYDSNKEFCKMTKSVPLSIFKLNCNDVNYDELINSSYRNKFIRNSSLLILLFLLINYILLFNKKTKILSSKINIGVLFIICIILSLYYSIMSYLDYGIQGPPGEKGLNGDIGLKGPKGLLGPRGFKGAVGVIGEKGDTGPIGPIGLQGDKGPIGIRGNRGDRGEKGPKGYKGIQGDIGLSGEKGVNGQRGPKGDKGKDGVLISEAVDGDSTKLHPLFTINSISQRTTWRQPYQYHNVHNEIKSHLKCNFNESTEYENKTYNECKDLCTDEVDSIGYKKCIGMYGNFDKNNPDGSPGLCFTCPEKILEKNEFINNLNKELIHLKSDSNWDKFITGYKLKTVKGETENDSVHAYLSNFKVVNK